ncbi:MAG: hypothetical protein KDJ38_18500 [Gammaproteobacteria bacterium]|nr:hypothetical protein [Gammaproteobacteria bacterium]
MLDASLIAVNDICEFVSDKQAEKGPSSGRVTFVDDDFIVIAHSDHPGQPFRKQDLIVNYGRNKPDWVYWELA